MSIPLLCISLLALLIIGLGFAVSSTRAKTETIFGSSTDPEDPLYKMIRAHGNTVEYAPILALVIYILSQQPQATWVLWCMILVTFFRYLFAAGIVFPKTLAKPNPLRFVGALGTYLAGLGLCIALLLQALS
ncbi:MAG: MAPEG family protein [Pseudomonadales bacterium]